MMLFLERIPSNSYFKTLRKTKAFGPVKQPYTIQALGHQIRDLGHQVQVCTAAPINVSLCMEVFISHQVLTQQIFQFTLVALPTLQT